MKPKIISVLMVAILIFTSGCANQTIENKDSTKVAEEDSSKDLTSNEISSQVPDVPVSTPQKERDDPNFRNSKWGDSPETVLEYETAELLDPNADQTETLVFKDTIAELDAYIVYAFDLELGLYHAVYGLQEEHTTSQLYISDYKLLKGILTEKYGNPSEDSITTLNDAADIVDEGTALEYGYRVYVASWETDSATIALAMMGDNFEITTVIDYISKEIVPSINTSGF